MDEEGHLDVVPEITQSHTRPSYVTKAEGTTVEIGRWYKKDIGVLGVPSSQFVTVAPEKEPGTPALG